MPTQRCISNPWPRVSGTNTFNRDNFYFNRWRNRRRRIGNPLLHDIFRFFHKKCYCIIRFHDIFLQCCEILILLALKTSWERCSFDRLRPGMHNAPYYHDGKYDWCSCQYNVTQLGPLNPFDNTYALSNCTCWHKVQTDLL